MYFSGGRRPAMDRVYKQDQTEGEVDIRAADPKSGQWIWQGWARETMIERLNPDDEIDKAVPMIMERFPTAT